MTTMTTNAATFAHHAQYFEKSLSDYDLCRAMYAWLTDRESGCARLLKDITHEFCVPQWLTTRVYLSVGWGLRPNAIAFQDLDAYVAAWRDALVQGLCGGVRVPGGSPRRASRQRAASPWRIGTRRTRSVRGGATPNARLRATGHPAAEPRVRARELIVIVMMKMMDNPIQ
jgi:hypothetical protein